MTGGAEKKRRWDCEKEEEEEKEKEDMKESAIKAAMEVAKKLSAKLESVSNPETDKTKCSLPDLLCKSTVSFDKNSSNSALFLEPSFPDRLTLKLQLSPKEFFKLRVEEEEGVLELEASSEDVLNLAETECKCIIKTGNFRSGNNSSIEKIFIGYDVNIPTVHASFLRGKLLGPQGSFLKHIHSTTGCRVQLRGKGSGFVEVKEWREVLPMYLFIERGGGVGEEEFLEARKLCEDLVETAKAEYEAKFFKPSQMPQYSPYSQYQNYQHYQQYPYPYPYSHAYPNPNTNTNTNTNPNTNTNININTNANTNSSIQGQYYQQYQNALAQYYSQFTQNKQE